MIKIPKLNKFDPVLIEFLDCHSVNMNWESEEEYFKTLETEPMILVAQFLSVDKLWIYVCLMRDPIREQINPDKFVNKISEMMKVPLGAIVKIKKLH